MLQCTTSMTQGKGHT